VDEVENLLDGNGKNVEVQRQFEERERVRGVRRSLAERRIQWLDRRDRMRTTPAVVERFMKVTMGELDEYEARNEVACLEIEEAFRFEQLMGNVVALEPAFRVFTWAMDWAFVESADEDEIPLAVQMRLWEEDERRKMQEEGFRSPFTQWRVRNDEVKTAAIIQIAQENEDEIPLAVQMRLWEEDERRKMQEEGIRSTFTQWRTRNDEEPDEGLNLGRLCEELRSLGRNRQTRIGQEQEQDGWEWQPDEWIRTSVWILDELGGGHQEGVARLRSVGLRIYPRTYTA
jgi:hypothetical protein